MNSATGASGATPHNLGLYRLQGFSGRAAQLRMLHEWMTGGDDLPAIAISGEQGNGKSTLATAAAWSLAHHFTDGIVRVGAAGANRFRLYDIVRTLDSVFGTTLTRISEDRWGISILEQLYRRRRLLLLDELSGATQEELDTLVDIIAHLHEAEGNSRILLIDRNFSPSIAALCQFQYVQLGGLMPDELPDFIQKRAPAPVTAAALAHQDDLFVLTNGRPYALRVLLGLMLDFAWGDLTDLLSGMSLPTGQISVPDVVAFAVENFAAIQPQVGPLLDRLVPAAGGASLAALRELFWVDLGTPAELDQVVAGLDAHALLDYDPFQQRVVMHPMVRAYLEQNAAMLGEEWERRHAAYYVRLLEEYQVLPLERWPELDPEWGNMYKGADWCAARLERLWQRPLPEMIANPAVDNAGLPLPEEAQTYRDDLRLARAYALAIAHYAFWRHPPGVLRWLETGAVASLALADSRNYAWLQTSIGRHLFFTGVVETAVEWFERAAAIFDARDLLTELAYAFTDLGTSYRVLDRPRQALTYFRAAYECVAQLGDQLGLATSYMNVGSAHYGMNEFERALQQQRKALRIAVRHHDNQRMASIYNSMGLAMEGLERLDEARQAYLHALELFRRTDDSLGISTCYNNLGSVSYAQNDFDQALMWYELDLGLSAHRGAWTDMAATLHNLGHVALEQEAWPRALAYFQQSRELYAAFALSEYMREEDEMIAYTRQNTPETAEPA
jgi:tetratricopeptide (TPR) repeat protein